MRIIITGATSFIGRAVSKRLKKAGHSVTEFHHSYDEAPERLPRTADCWIHLAWAGKGSEGRSDEETQDYNVEMSLDALRRASEIGCTKFMFAGSQAEYGGVHTRHLDGKQHEDDICDPVSAYGKAKYRFYRAASQWVYRFNHTDDVIAGGRPMHYIHLRLFSVYGPGDHETSLINTLLRTLAAGEEMKLGPCTQDWNYMYIDDAARAIELLVNNETADGVYNVASSDTRPLREYVNEVHHILGGRGSMVYSARANNAEGAAGLRPNIARINYLGFMDDVLFGEGIRNTMESLGIN